MPSSSSPPARPRWFSWKRAACLGATAALLWIAFRRIDGPGFFQALRRTDPVRSGAAFLIYGLALAAGAWRWHVALRATEQLVHWLATWRLALAGHFYYTALLGVVGGDVAKSVTYARWFRFSLAEVLAAAPLDRVLSLGAAGMVAVMAVGAALVSGGFRALAPIHGPSLFWVLGGLGGATLVFLAWMRWRPRGDGPWARTLRAIHAGGLRLATSPRAAGSGLLAATLAQASLSAVFALNLAAVTHASISISWAQLGWTFPAITTFGSIPFTFAGAGVREVAAVTLLGCYGVPAGDCLAASLLTVGMRLAWAGIGALVLWREQIRQQQVAGRSVPQTVSVIISMNRHLLSPSLSAPSGGEGARRAGEEAIRFMAPTHVRFRRSGLSTNHETSALLETIRHAQRNHGICEIIVVDDGNDEETRLLAANLGCQVFSGRFDSGHSRSWGPGHIQATGDVVLLLQGDTWLPSHAIDAAINCLRDASVVAGGFWPGRRGGSWRKVGSQLGGALRFWFAQDLHADQGIFIRREVWEQLGRPPEVLLTDPRELRRQLRAFGRLALAPAQVTTAVRGAGRAGREILVETKPGVPSY